MKNILVLDDDEDLCLMLREVFLSFGVVNCELTHSLKDLQKIPEKILKQYNLALLDINLGVNMPTGLDAYRWLQAQAFPGKIIFFTGHAQSDPRVQEIERTTRASILEKPASTETLKQLL